MEREIGGAIFDGSIGREVTPVAHTPAYGAASTGKEASPVRETSCPSCRAAAGAGMPFVYAVGRIEPRFLSSPSRRSSFKRPGAPKRRDSPTVKCSTLCCRNGRTAISSGRCAGY
jgi:hypothetical protein